MLPSDEVQVTFSPFAMVTVDGENPPAESTTVLDTGAGVILPAEIPASVIVAFFSSYGEYSLSSFRYVSVSTREISPGTGTVDTKFSSVGYNTYHPNKMSTTNPKRTTQGSTDFFICFYKIIRSVK